MLKKLGFLLIAITQIASAQEHSDLWGKNGELWQPAGRLPDFSYAGYHRGEDAIPTVEVVGNVRDFGAKGDGVNDDTSAFKKAIQSVERGAILIPEGRYLLTDIIEVRRPNIVLRGAGSDKTILYFPKFLNDIKPNMGATTGGRPTSNYSWSGGFVHFKGDFRSHYAATITDKASRGDRTLTVNSTSKIKVGQYVEIRENDTDANTLAHHLYSDDPGNVDKLLGRTRASLVCKVVKIDGRTIEIDRALRFDIKREWTPVVLEFSPTVTESGIESVCFEFPNIPYAGHFTELGHNAVAMSGVAHCWAKDIRIVNADSGFFLGGRFCTVDGVVFDSDRKRDSNNDSTGHHGFLYGQDDNLFTRFVYNTKFIHDITVSHCAGNVFSDGKGEDLCFDHHKHSPYENLFTNLDLGAGTRMWKCGGGADLGRQCGARGTFWGIDAERNQSHPGGFGPASINLVGVKTNRPAQKEPDGKWFEVISPSAFEPKNLHQAQLKRRLANESNGNPSAVKDALQR